jgi:hypothetical protein
MAAFYADLFPRPEKRQGAWMSDFIYGGPDGKGGGRTWPTCAPTSRLPRTTARPSSAPRRGDALPRVRPPPPPLHLAGPHRGAGRDQRGVGLGGASEPAHGELDLGADGPRPLLRTLADGGADPRASLRRMHRARRFLGGWMQMRQLSFGIMDLALHGEYDPAPDGDPVAWATERILHAGAEPGVRRRPPPPLLPAPLPGRYAASYYAYLWSEVLEADLFGRFREEGIFSRDGARTTWTRSSRGEMPRIRTSSSGLHGAGPRPRGAHRPKPRGAAPEVRDTRRTAVTQALQARVAPIRRRLRTVPVPSLIPGPEPASLMSNVPVHPHAGVTADGSTAPSSWGSVATPAPAGQAAGAPSPTGLR